MGFEAIGEFCCQASRRVRRGKRDFVEIPLDLTPYFWRPVRRSPRLRAKAGSRWLGGFAWLETSNRELECPGDNSAGHDAKASVEGNRMRSPVTVGNEQDSDQEGDRQDDMTGLDLVKMGLHVHAFRA